MSSKTFREEIDISADPRDYLLALKRHWLPATGCFGIVAALTLVIALSQETTYEASGKVLVESDEVSTLSNLAQGEINPLGRVDKIGPLADPIVTEVEIIRSVPIAEATISALSLKDDQGKPLSLKDFFRNLTAKPIGGTDMIQIAYKSESPEVSASVVNKLIEIYVQDNAQTNRAKAEKARQLVAAELPESEAAVRDAELALRQFREQNQIVALEEESTEIVQSMARLNDQVTLSKAQLADTSAQISALQNQLSMSTQEAIEATALSQAPGIQLIFTQLQELEAQLDVERSRYRPNHPNVLTLERQKADLQARLQRQISQVLGYSSEVSVRDLQIGELGQQLTGNLVQAEASRLGLINQINELSSLQAAQRNRAIDFPRLESTQRELERQLNAAQTTYEALLQKLQEIKIAENQVVGNIRVISSALIPEEGSSNKKLILALGLVTATLVALSVISLLELLGNSSNSSRDIENLFDYSMAGTLPSAQNNNPPRATGVLSGDDELER